MCQILDKYLKYTVSIILSKNKHTCMRFEVLKKKFVIDGYIPLFFPSCFKNQRKWNRTVIRVIHNLFLFKKRKRKYFYSVCNVIFIGVLFILFSLYKCNIFQWRFLKQAANVCMPVDNLFMSYFCLISYLMNPGIVINFHWGRGQKFNVIKYWFKGFLQNIWKSKINLILNFLKCTQNWVQPSVSFLAY